MSGDIQEAKQNLPLPALIHRLGLSEHAKKSARCPFHDDQHNSFSVWRDHAGLWHWKCHAGCGQGDEIDFIACCKQFSKSEAIKLFLEMAGLAQTRTALPTEKSNSENPTPIDWQRCVDAFTEKHLERLAEWRGYSGEVCSWLKESRLVGLHDNCIAFPVHDRAGKVVAVHYRLKDGSWRYYPQGAKVRPLVIGELIAGEPVHVFESQWDCFAFLDVSGERTGVIVTRGTAAPTTAACHPERSEGSRPLADAITQARQFRCHFECEIPRSARNDRIEHWGVRH
jgi:CHC2-type zinc finger protein